MRAEEVIAVQFALLLCLNGGVKQILDVSCDERQYGRTPGV
jgi:hypothetical protein